MTFLPFPQVVLLQEKTNKSNMSEICDKDFQPEYMELAAKLAFDNVDAGGGPFGAVIVRNGEVISMGVNSVTILNDPTAHAEINAIRNACSALSSFNLPGCVVYSSCEPCPMCMSALYWAGVKKIFYGNTQKDAEAIDFHDKFIYDEIELPPARRRIPGIKVDNSQTLKAFQKWMQKEDRIKY